jgi:uncharacterized protein with GYD domain
MMARYIVLAKMTQQGIQNAKEIPQRRAAGRETAKTLGITWVDSYLTMGGYDVVIVLDAPESEAIAKFVLQIGMRGNLATETLRAFSDEEVDRLLAAI